MHTESRPLLSPEVNAASLVEPSMLKKSQKCGAGLALFLASSILVAGGWWYRHEWTSETSQHADSPLVDYIGQKVADSSDSEKHENDGYTDSALADEIAALPGIDVNTLNFRQFSGYLDANDGRQLFYWFVESQNDPDNDPLLMWTNGGPGCSSLLGLLSEHGPFWVDPDLQLYVNDYAWNKRVNIFYIEQPYGVGFSVTGDESYVLGDRNASLDMDTAIRSFLIKFPKYLHHPLSISGESYAGHYLPTLALTILMNNDDGYNPRINFKGLLVGNPYTDSYSNANGFMKALYGHGIVSDRVMNEWDANCHNLQDELVNPICDKAYVDAYENAGDVNFYAMDFDECTFNNMRKFPLRGHMHTGMIRKKITNVLDSKILNNEETKRYEAVLKKHSLNDDSTPYWPCVGDYLDTYLNQGNVQDALHVKKNEDKDEDEDKDPTVEWEECNYDLFYDWPDSDWLTGMEDIYQVLVDEYDISIMIYSGDDDAVCSTQGTQYWLDRMGWNPAVVWEVWEDENNQVGGYYTAYAQSSQPQPQLPDPLLSLFNDTTAPPTKNKITIHYYTVRSSGHMVPTTTPARGLAILQFYLDLPGVSTR